MNPIVKVKQASHYVIYKLTDSDKKKLNQVSLIGEFGQSHQIAMHQMCIMQAVSMVSTQEITQEIDSVAVYVDHPVCVSPTIADFLIQINDSNISKRQRNSLKKLIPDILNTAPIKRKYLKTKVVDTPLVSDPAFREAEKKRLDLLGDPEDSMIGDMIEKRGGFAKLMKMAKEAADLYHAPDEGADKEVVEV